MSDTETLMRATLTTDGQVLIEQPDGSYRAARGETDRSKVARMSDAKLEAVIAEDPTIPAMIRNSGNTRGSFIQASRTSPFGSMPTCWTGSGGKAKATKPASTPSFAAITSTRGIGSAGS